MAVVIPAYNRATLLPRAIASIAAQRPYQPSEVIVVDDASKDDTAIVASALGARVLRHTTNLGPAAARNTGFAAATAPWLMQLDSDDEWLPHCLATLWALRQDHVLITGGSIGHDVSGRPRYNGPRGDTPQLLESPAELVFPDNFVASSAVLLRASCVRAVGGYRTDLRYAEDLELWLRMLEVGDGVATPTPVVRYHRHEHQATAAEGQVHAGHAWVLAMSVDRAWWRPWLPVRWSAIAHWDGLRSSLTERDRRAVMRHAMALLSDPQRLLGLAIVLRFRFQGRRQSSRVTIDGLPSVALLPGASDPRQTGDIDLRGYTLVASLLRLARRPTASAIVGRRWHRLLLALLRIRADRRSVESDRPRDTP